MSITDTFHLLRRAIEMHRIVEFDYYGYFVRAIPYATGIDHAGNRVLAGKVMSEGFPECTVGGWFYFRIGGMRGARMTSSGYEPSAHTLLSVGLRLRHIDR